MNSAKEELVPGQAEIRPDSGPVGPAGKLHVTPEALRLLPAEFVKRHRVLPLKVHEGAIHTATCDPGNQKVVDDIRLITAPTTSTRADENPCRWLRPRKTCLQYMGPPAKGASAQNGLLAGPRTSGCAAIPSNQPGGCFSESG